MDNKLNNGRGATAEATVDKLIKAGLIPEEYREDAIRNLDQQLRRQVRRFTTDMALVTARTVTRPVMTAA
jgi:hypothetical protein